MFQTYLASDMSTESTKTPITPEMEQKMRLFANLIIDRIFEDKKNNTLKFQSNSKNSKKADSMSADDISS